MRKSKDGTTIDISPHKEGLLFKGSTYYQIKWGKTFDPRKESHLTKELLTTGNDLKQGVGKIAQSCSQHPVIQSNYFNPLTQYFLTLDQWRGQFVSGKEDWGVLLIPRERLGK